MNEISREAGGLPMLFILKSAILIFVILLFLQVLSKIIEDTLNFIIKNNPYYNKQKEIMSNQK